MPVVQGAVTSFTVTSATTFEVSDVSAFGGNTPKGAILWCSRNTAKDTTEDHGFFGIWGLTQYEIVGGCMRYHDDRTTNEVRRTNSDGDISGIADIGIVAINSSTVETRMTCNGDGIGSNAGPITNGWRFSVVNYTADVVFNVLLLGGDDFECNTLRRRVDEAIEDIPHGLGKSNTMLGLCYYGNETSFGSLRTRGSVFNSVGMFATNDGGTTINQWAVGQREFQGAGAQDIVGNFHTDKCVAASNRNEIEKSNTHTRQGYVSGIDSTNIEWTRDFWEVVNLEPIFYVWVMAIPDSMNAWVSNYIAQTSGGTFTPSSQPGFTPGVYGALASGHSNTDIYETVEECGAWSFGIQDEDGNHGSASIIVEGEMLNTENTYAKSLTSANLINLVTVSSESQTSACSWPVATFIGTGIEIASPGGTKGGRVGAFAFELDNTGVPIDESVTDSLVLTDAAPVVAVEFNKSITEVLSLLDVIVGQGPLVETLIESLNFTDEAAVASPFFYTATDTLVFSDLAEPSGIVPPQGVGQRGGRTFEDMRAMRAAERLQVLARQDRELLEFLKRTLTKL